MSINFDRGPTCFDKGKQIIFLAEKILNEASQSGMRAQNVMKDEILLSIVTSVLTYITVCRLQDVCECTKSKDDVLLDFQAQTNNDESNM